MILAFLGPNKPSVIERCPYYRGVRKERLDCTSNGSSEFTDDKFACKVHKRKL